MENAVAMTPAADSGGRNASMQAAGEVASTRVEPLRAAGGAGGTALGRSMGSAGSPAIPPIAGSGRVRGSTSQAGASAGNDAGAAASAGAAGACPVGASACGGECTDNQDCERRGITNGLCSGGICYPPAAECSADKDCEKKGPEFVGGRCLNSQCRPNPRWRCEPPPKPVDGETRQIDVPVIDALSLGAMADVQIVACDKRDLTCDRPVTSAKTGRDGHLHMTLPTNFAGYLQQTEVAGYMPAMYFVPQLIPNDGVLDGFPLMRSGLAIDGLAASVGSRVDRTRGHMMLIVEDCQSMPVGGVKFSSPQQDASTLLYYVQDNLPAANATVTFDAGQGGFLNFPVGTATVVLTQVKTGVVLNSVSLLVRAGFITVAFMPPQSR